jgi:hypothetical protein
MTAVTELCGRLAVIEAIDTWSARSSSGFVLRITGERWKAVEHGVAAVTERMLVLLPTARAAALARGPVAVDLDATDVGV